MFSSTPMVRVRIYGRLHPLLIANAPSNRTPHVLLARPSLGIGGKRCTDRDGFSVQPGRCFCICIDPAGYHTLRLPPRAPPGPARLAAMIATGVIVETGSWVPASHAAAAEGINFRQVVHSHRVVHSRCTTCALHTSQKGASYIL